MSDTWLPVQVGGNARWVFFATEEQYVQAFTTVTQAGGVETHTAQLGWFPAVPDNEMWVYNRIALMCEESGVGVIRLFIDPRGGEDPAAEVKLNNHVGGVWNAQPIEVLSEPYPLQVQPSTQLGVVFLDATTGDMVPGHARAQVTRYRRP